MTDTPAPAESAYVPAPSSTPTPAVSTPSIAWVVTRPGHGYAIGARIEDASAIPDIRIFAVPVSISQEA